MTRRSPAARASRARRPCRATASPSADMDLDRAELRFGLSDPRGLGANPGFAPAASRSGSSRAAARQRPAAAASSPGSTPRRCRPADQRRLRFRLPRQCGSEPRAACRRHALAVRSAWPHPSFGGGFLPTQRRSAPRASRRVYRVGNLALGRSLVSTGDAGVGASGADLPAGAATTRAPAGGDARPRGSA